MNTTSSPRHAREWITNLAAKGQYSFSSVEAREALGVSPAAAKLSLNRLCKQQSLASPARGYYVIVPPEYRSLGCLPADQFIPSLMQHLKLPYYAGLLSAAQYHGAAHHRPQSFQVMLARHHRPIECGLVSIDFFIQKRVSEIPVQSFNTPRGTILVSSPEATAFDLVGYVNRVGGMDQVVNVLVELAEKLDPAAVLALAPTVPLPWVQRLGYLLEFIDAGQSAAPIHEFVKQRVIHEVPLWPNISSTQSKPNARWRLSINVDLEPDF